MIPFWIQALIWGLVVGSGFLLGAIIAFFSRLHHRAIAAVMGFGSGVLISVISFELMEEAYVHGGIVLTIFGFLGGGALFSLVNWYLSKRGAKHRKRCGQCVVQPSESEVSGSGISIAIGAMFDGIPEAIIIGLSLISGESIGILILVGFYISNIPQGLSSAEGMKGAGRSAAYIFAVWSGIVLISGLAALFGYSVLGLFSPKIVAFMTAFSAGGVLAMLAETMIPEAFEKAQNFIGIITVAGFLAFFSLLKLL
jgi:ZIP family zinc transporter